MYFVYAFLLKDSACYDSNGRIYSGRQNVSRSGLPCLSWADQLADINVTHNYCRNFNGANKTPWCYIARGIPEECDVPKCDVSGIWPFMNTYL